MTWLPPVSLDTLGTAWGRHPGYPTTLRGTARRVSMCPRWDCAGRGEIVAYGGSFTADIAEYGLRCGVCGARWYAWLQPSVSPHELAK